MMADTQIQKNAFNEPEERQTLVSPVRRHTIAVTVENEFGVLARVAGLFSGRGYNLESLSVAETLEPGVSRITLTTSGTDLVIEQITKQLNRLINVLKVVDLTDLVRIDRELVLIKVAAESASARDEVTRAVEVFRAKIIDAWPRGYVIEATGDAAKLKGLIDLLRPLGIKEVVRTGQVAIARGDAGGL